MIRMNDTEFLKLCTFVNEKYGLNLSKKRVLVEYRLMSELQYYQTKNFQEYLNLLFHDKDGVMKSRLINKITTNYTFFLREPTHFQYILEHILPQYRISQPFYIWIAGCSSGQECYTLAMYLEDWRRSGKLMPKVSITATDINSNVLHEARDGIYSMEAYDTLPTDWKNRYCSIMKDGKHFQIKDCIRKQVSFFQHNLVDPFHPLHFHLIMCRNVLIYFDEHSRQKIIHSFHNDLRPQGYLILGHAEMMSTNNHLFTYLGSSVYRAKE